MTMNKCWICNDREADSGEHTILKSVLDYVMGKPCPGSPRFFYSMNRNRKRSIASFKNNCFKFKKSICSTCNGALTQPFDQAFKGFIEGIFKSKNSIIRRGKIVFSRRRVAESKNLSLYFIKVLGCLLVASKLSVNDRDFQLLRNSLLSGVTLTNNVYLSLHRDLKHIEIKRGIEESVSFFPLIKRDCIALVIELDWLSIVISYPFPPDQRYGDNWRLGDKVFSLKLGKLV